MNIRCVVRARNGDPLDVVLEVDPTATAVDLALTLREHGVEVGTVRIDGRAVAPEATLVAHPIAQGSVIDVGGDRREWLPADGPHLVVVSGPEAGAWYPLPVGRPLRVGRSDGEVRLERDEVMSRLHVQFETDGTRVRVTDLGSRNGTIVEGVRIGQPQFVEPDTYVHAGSSILTVVMLARSDRAVLGSPVDGVFPFPRSFREAFPALVTEFRLPRPPTKSDGGGSTWWRSLIPVVTGVGMAVVMQNLIFLLFSALAPLVYAGDAMMQRRRRLAEADGETAKYRETLAATRQAYLDTATEQRRRERATNPSGGVANLFATVRHRRLWERRPSDEDFLSVTVGFASRPSAAAVIDQSADDPRPERRPVWGTPVSLALAATGSATVLGSPDRGRGVVRSLLLGLAVTHSPTDVCFWLFAGADAERPWGGLRWLPHVMIDEQTCRIATTDLDRASMMSTLRQLIDSRKEQRRGFTDAAALPVHVVVFDGASILTSAELSDVLVSGPPLGIYGIVIDPSVAPDGTMGTLRLGGTADEATFESRIQSRIERVLTAEMPTQWFESGARQMAALRPSFSGEAVLSATSARLATLVDATSTSPEQLAQRWAANGPTTAVRVGTTSEGGIL